ANGTLLINGGADKLLSSRALDNANVASWREGAIVLDGGAVITNLPNATFKFGDHNLSGNGEFRNLGILDKVAGLGIVPVYPAVINDGSILVHSGGVQLRGGGRSSGSIWANLGAEIDVAAGT